MCEGWSLYEYEVRTIDTKENLCDFCLIRMEIPKCIPIDVRFGDGVGKDNIIACSHCIVKEYTNTIYPEYDHFKRRKKCGMCEDLANKYSGLCTKCEEYLAKELKETEDGNRIY